MVAAGRDRELGREVACEAFARAFERWDRVRLMESPDGWVYRVALNVLKRRKRRARIERALLARRRPEPVLPPGFDPQVWEAVASLPDRARQAVALRYVAEFTQAEIAEVMGVATGTVASTLHTARRRLAELLSDREETDAQVDHG